MPQAIRTVFRDPAIRYGIKFGLAGILAVFIALFLRLEEPTWALFTVFVLMIAQYVGAIAEKSLFRIIGTVAGGLLGYFLTASFEQNPVIFVILVSLIVGACTAMFGQSRYPYAFLLCALTMVVVVGNGLGDPDNSWQYALWRIEEVTLGILVVMLVQSQIWPRFAREEFLRNSRLALADLQDCLRESSQAVFDGHPRAAAAKAADFPARISALRGLLDFGARESQYFRDRLPTYFEITSCLSRVAANLATMTNPLPAGSYYHTHLRRECLELGRSLEAALADLAGSASTQESRAARSEEMTAAHQRLESRLLSVHDDPELPDLAPEAIVAMSLHLLALEEIRKTIARMQILLDSLPTGWMEGTRREPHPFTSPIPPPFWIRSGVKTTIAVAAALVLLNWLNPPGGAILVLGAWVFTALNATSPGGRGDRRAFHYVITSTLVLLVVCLILIGIRPFLSSYAVMNTLIFSWSFLWGYLSFQTRGITIPMQLAMLLIVSILGLNGEEPISVQAVANIFFGLSFAMLLSALVQRLLWPSLPQWELRDRIVELLRILRQGMTASLPLWEQVRIALIPGEAAIRINHLQLPFCTSEDRQNLREYLGNLHQISTHLLVSAGGLSTLTAKNENPGDQTRIAELEKEIRAHLQAHEIGMKTATVPLADCDRLSALLTSWMEWIVATRQRMLRENCPSLDILQYVGLAGRLAESARGLLHAKTQADNLHLPNYMGDYVL